MGRYVKSVTDTKELTNSLIDLKEEFANHSKILKRNNKELEKINNEVEINKDKEIKTLQQKIKNLENQTQWVQNDEPALKIDSVHMLKKLNIL